MKSKSAAIGPRTLGALQLDALREVATIGAGHAATALSQLTNRRILLSVPETRLIDLESVRSLHPKGEDVVAAVSLKMLGDLTGRNVQVYPGSTASRLAGLLLGMETVRFPDDFAEMEVSALKEAANILAGAYLSALSDFLGMLVLASVPMLRMDRAAEILTGGYLCGDTKQNVLLCVETLFGIDEREAPLKGYYLLLPDPASLQAILRAIRLD